MSWIGCRKGDSRHKHIIDTYNTIKPLPSGYKMTYSANWCAATVSAAYHEAGYDDIFPFECSCGRMITLAKKMGCWVENDNYTPNIADCVIYDWDDNGVGDDTTGHDHIGLVVEVNGNAFNVGEGNVGKASECRIRKMKVNGKYIRGFVTPNFGTESKPETKLNTDVSTYPTIKRGDKGAWVTLMQNLLIARGYSVGKDGPDGDFGKNTEEGLMVFQADKGLQVDGICGYKTWSALTK